MQPLRLISMLFTQSKIALEKSVNNVCFEINSNTEPHL